MPEILIAAPPEITAALSAILRGRYPCVPLAVREATEIVTAATKTLGKKSFSCCIVGLSDAAGLKKLAGRFPDTLFLPLALENRRRQCRDLLAVGAFAVILLPLDKHEVADVLGRAETFLSLRSGAQPIRQDKPLPALAALAVAEATSWPLAWTIFLATALASTSTA
jgi:hypothetical protein